MHSLIRGVVAVAIVGAVAAWVIASNGEAPALPDAPDLRRVAADADRAAMVEASVARLRARLADMPARPEGTRNPFRFEARARASHAHAPRTAALEVAQVIEAAAPAPAARPELRLIGMAEDAHDGVTERTAIVSGLNQVYLVKEGEQIAMRFLVKRIGADAVEIEDLSDSTPLTLGLR